MTQPTAVDAIRQAIANQAKSTAGGWLGSSLVAALGAGAAGRGLLGLYHMQSSQPPAEESLTGALTTDLPLPPEEEDPKKIKRAWAATGLWSKWAQSPQPVQLKPSPGVPTAQSLKAWNNLNAASGNLRAPVQRPVRPAAKPSALDAVAAQLGRRAPQPSVAQAPLEQPKLTLAPTTGVPRPMAGPAELSRVQQLRPAAPVPPSPTAITKRSSAYNFLLGDHATTPQGVPWLMPGIALGGAAAGATGWKLVDYILDKRRKAELETDVDKARGEFQQALLSAYPGQKQAAAGTLGAELDALYDDFEKTAAASDWAGGAAGLAGTGMGMLGMLAALVSYQEASKRSRRSLMNKATSSWQRSMWREQPPAVQVTPKRQPPAAIPQTEELEPEGVTKEAGLPFATLRKLMSKTPDALKGTVRSTLRAPKAIGNAAAATAFSELPAYVALGLGGPQAMLPTVGGLAGTAAAHALKMRGAHGKRTLLPYLLGGGTGIAGGLGLNEAISSALNP